MHHSLEDTIIALSTPSGTSLRAILRISGTDALNCIDNLFVLELNPRLQTDGKTSFVDISRHLTHGINKPTNTSLNSRSKYISIKDAETYTSINGYIVIEKEQTAIPVTLYIMKSPRSFTKEDVVEIHTFGAAPIIEMILEEILFGRTNGTVRMAEPGEFTKRAFLNGRIDLTQVESVMKIIRSKSDSEILAGMSLLNGKARRLINEIKGQLVDLCSRVEASIDFSDQDISLITSEEIENQISLILKELRQLIAGDKTEKRIFVDGVNVAFYGRPNVGKSSLLNTLEPDIKTIVSESANTTRDSIRRSIKIDGVSFNFIDNPGVNTDLIGDGMIDAGQNGNYHTVAFKSFEKTQDSLSSADIILYVLDGSCELDDIDRELFDKIKDRKKIVVVNKCDLPQKMSLDELNNGTDKFPVVMISTVTKAGASDMIKELLNFVVKGNVDQSGSQLIINTRQCSVLNDVVRYLDYSLKTAKDHESDEFIALDLRNALDSLGEIAGSVITDDLLDKIFSEFCVGK